MIQNDGGKGDFLEVVPTKLGIWNTLLQGEADATWVFSGWEGCAASLANIDLMNSSSLSMGKHQFPSLYVMNTWLEVQTISTV